MESEMDSEEEWAKRRKLAERMIAGNEAPARTDAFYFKCKGQEGSIPKIGFGTSTLKGDVCREAVGSALEAGCRHIDTALLYGNQVEVGKAIRASGIAREEIWVTSKVACFPADSKGVWQYNPNNVKGREAASIEQSLRELQLSHVDLLLVHNPITAKSEYCASCVPHWFELFNAQGTVGGLPLKLPDGENARNVLMKTRLTEARLHSQSSAAKATARMLREETWRNMEQALREGRTRFIGVSNYSAELLVEMAEYATVLPCVNQLEFHPRFASPKLLEIAEKMGVVLTGYGSGMSTKVECESQTNEVILAVANQHHVSATEIVLAWTLRKGVAVIPRTTNKDHIAANLRVLESVHLTDRDMFQLDSLNENYPYYWDQTPSTDTWFPTIKSLDTPYQTTPSLAELPPDMMENVKSGQYGAVTEIDLLALLNSTGTMQQYQKFRDLVMSGSSARLPCAAGIACTNNGLLLCCRSCPRNFHTYCVQPPMHGKPNLGTWICLICTNRAQTHFNPDDPLSQPRMNGGGKIKL